MRKIFFLLLMLASPAFAAPTVGQPAPAFEAMDIEGKAQSVELYKGRIVVLEWNNPGCPFVKKFYDSGEMQRLQKQAAERGVVWLTINSGAPGKQGYMSVDEARKQAAAWNLASAAYILDPEGAIGKRYGATATPHMFVIDKEGRLIYVGAIDDKPSADPKDIPLAKNYVTAAIDAAEQGAAATLGMTEAYGCAVKYAD